MDAAVVEGFVIGALWQSQFDGWSDVLKRHVHLRVVLTELAASERDAEYGNGVKARELAGAADGTSYSAQSVGYGSTYYTTVVQGTSVPLRP